MKQITTLLLSLCVLSGAIGFANHARAQQARPNGKQGLNMFETPIKDTTPFKGASVQIGGFFAQDYQALNDQNTAVYVPTNKKPISSTNPAWTDSTNANLLDPLTNGFNLAEADLTVDAIISDGISFDATLYLASRHHSETWVKGGYVQFDKLTFFHSDAIDALMKNVTLKMGAMDVDYGDAHYRRADGGNEMHNPFVENLIMDDFATEVGAEGYYKDDNGFLALIGLTDGQLNPTDITSSHIDVKTNQTVAYDPAYHFKLGYDKQLNSDLRLRLTGSYYGVQSTSSSTLFGGDRTGSHYFSVMENTESSTGSNPFSGRYNPGFSTQVSTFMLNPFIKFGGLEFFGVYEQAQGRSFSEASMRKATQVDADLIYRFGPNEDFWVGGRYNTLTATPAPVSANIPDVTIDRVVGSVGWFMTNNVMMKAEYVQQTYKNFASTSIFNGGKFDGVMVEAAIGF